MMYFADVFADVLFWFSLFRLLFFVCSLLPNQETKPSERAVQDYVKAKELSKIPARQSRAVLDFISRWLCNSTMSKTKRC